MSHDNNDLRIPSLGSADRSLLSLKVDESEKKYHTEQVAARSRAQAGSGGGWFTTFILVLLTAACSGLGYLGFGLQQTVIEQQRALIAQQQTASSAAARITELEKMLNVASDSATQTGQTLEQRLLQVNQDANAKYGFYDAEIAKLWDIANKHNKNSIDALGAEFKVLAERVIKTDQTHSVLAKQQQQQTQLLAIFEQTFEQKIQQLAALTDQAGAVDKKLTELLKVSDTLAKNQQLLGKEQITLKSSGDKNLKSLKQSLATLQTQIAIFEETLGEEQFNQQASLKNIVSRLSAVEKSSRRGDSNVETRVKTNEQAIRAIDGTRRQMNSDILLLTNKLNALQLKVNKL